MRKIIFTLAALAASTAALSAIGSAPASASGNNAYCIANGQDSSFGHCDFSSYDQCKATVSGGSGTCTINPAFATRETGNAFAKMPAPRRVR